MKLTILRDSVPDGAASDRKEAFKQLVFGERKMASPAVGRATPFTTIGYDRFTYTGLYVTLKDCALLT